MAQTPENKRQRPSLIENFCLGSRSGRLQAGIRRLAQHRERDGNRGKITGTSTMPSGRRFTVDGCLMVQQRDLRKTTVGGHHLALLIPVTASRADA